MLEFTFFRQKIRHLVCFLALMGCSIISLTAQTCPIPTGLSKDSTSITQVHFSWNAVGGVRGYKVIYQTPSGTSTLITPSNRVSFAKPLDTSFEVFSVTSICTNGTESAPSSIIHGGIVVTIDDIFRYQKDCEHISGEDDFFFFSDICMYTHIIDLCAAIAQVNANWNSSNPPSPGAWSGIDPWLAAVLNELSNGNYLWEVWDNPDGCMPPGFARIAQAQLSELTIAPNPFSASFQLQFHVREAQAVRISLFDGMGKRHFYQKISINSGGYQQIGRLGQQLPVGLYYLRVETKDQQINLPVLRN